jgi:DNA-binding protein
MSKISIDYKTEKFLITDEPVMKLASDVAQILNKIGKITIKGKSDFCPSAVSVANIITQTILRDSSKTEKISVSSELTDDGRLISTIEIIITKISS